MTTADRIAHLRADADAWRAHWSVDRIQRGLKEGRYSINDVRSVRFAFDALPALLDVVEAAREVAETPWYPGGHPVSSEDMDPLRAALAKLDEAEQ